MKTWVQNSIFFLIVILGLSTIGWKIHNDITKNRRIQELEEKLENLEKREQDTTHSGGAESVPEYTPADFEEGYDFLFPIAEEDFFYYSSAYGIRVSPILGVERKHEGVDIAGVYNSQVVAVADGVVLEHWPAPGTPHPGGGIYKGHNIYGGYVVIDHGDGVFSKYAHMSWTRVHQGNRIRAGQVIGRIGNTGMADGNHLHFELEIDGNTVNPLLYIPNPKKNN